MNPSIVAALLILPTVAGAAEPINIASRRELFVDDHLIDRLTGTAELRLHHPTPREVALAQGVLSEEELARLLEPLAMTRPQD